MVSTPKSIGFLTRITYSSIMANVRLCFLSRYPLFNLLSDYLKAMWIVLALPSLLLILALEQGYESLPCRGSLPDPQLPCSSSQRPCQN